MKVGVLLRLSCRNFVEKRQTIAFFRISVRKGDREKGRAAICRFLSKLRLGSFSEEKRYLFAGRAFRLRQGYGGHAGAAVIPFFKRCKFRTRFLENGITVRFGGTVGLYGNGNE